LEAWVSIRLGCVEAGGEERSDGRRHGEARDRTRDDVTAWSVDDAASWLYTSGGLSKAVIGNLLVMAAGPVWPPPFELRGAQMLTLDDQDLMAAGVESLVDRQRALHALAKLRFRSRRVVGTAKNVRFIDETRRRTSALAECHSHVVFNAGIPLNIGRLLERLWAEEGALLGEAISMLEVAISERRAREIEMLEAQQAVVRRAIEAQMVRTAAAEDATARVEEELRFEQIKVKVLIDEPDDRPALCLYCGKESAPSAGREWFLLKEATQVASVSAKLFAKEVPLDLRDGIGRHRHYAASDYTAAQVPWDLGETLQQMGEGLGEMVISTVQEGHQRVTDLKRGDRLSKTLERAAEDSGGEASKKAAEARKKKEEERMKREAKEHEKSCMCRVCVAVRAGDLEALLV